jgi:hypothetical protein
VTRASIRVGGACGFWGDSAIAAPQLVRGGGLDYLVFDYLAEITMSIMRARAKDPTQGYAKDFVDRTLRDILVDCDRNRITLISNAGGMNPLACAAAVRALVKELDLNLKVAVVTGDDLIDRAERFSSATEMFSGEPFPSSPISINAYLGAAPIAEALNMGADIVITGRCADSALVLGACIHAFGWRYDELNKLAGASLAGHILECGAQATGGLFTDWEQVPDWDNIGYPIAEIDPQGQFTVSKPEGTGGLVTIGTVAEQMLYEIGDPCCYILPDVVCDFSNVHLGQVSANHVRVTGAAGRPSTGTYKVSLTWQDGFRLGLMLTIIGVAADLKARRVAASVLKRVARMLKAQGLEPFGEISTEILGAEWQYGPHAQVRSPREVVLKIAAKHSNPAALELLLREATSSGTSMSAGITGMGGNRPKPMPLVRLFSFLVPVAEVAAKVHSDGGMVDIPPTPTVTTAQSREPSPSIALADLTSDTVDVPLITLALGRSGDKGNSANIGVIARRPEYLPWIRRSLTEKAVSRYFEHLCEGTVTRFEVPGIHGLNFLLTRALGGGGIASLRNDPQGKGYAQMLLEHPVAIPREFAERDGLMTRQQQHTLETL